jgi:hypothetical protein
MFGFCNQLSAVSFSRRTVGHGMCTLSKYKFVISKGSCCCLPSTGHSARHEVVDVTVVESVKEWTLVVWIIARRTNVFPEPLPRNGRDADHRKRCYLAVAAVYRVTA